jgi:hypothetical protein
MTPEIIKALAVEIANQTILNNWLFYIVLACLTVIISAAGAYIASYYAKLGERAVLTKDFDEIKRQLKETTETAESVKAEIQHLADRTEKLHWLKREKLELYLEAVISGIEHQKKEALHRLHDADAPSASDPIDRASMLAQLYLPELEDENRQLMEVIGNFRLYIAEGMQLRTRFPQADGRFPPPPKEHADLLRGKYAALHLSKSVVIDAAKKLAQELNQL